MWESPCREVHDKLNILPILGTATSNKKLGRLKFALENLNYDRDRDYNPEIQKKMCQEWCVISFHACHRTNVEIFELTEKNIRVVIVSPPWTVRSGETLFLHVFRL